MIVIWGQKKENLIPLIFCNICYWKILSELSLTSKSHDLVCLITSIFWTSIFFPCLSKCSFLFGCVIHLSVYCPVMLGKLHSLKAFSSFEAISDYPRQICPYFVRASFSCQQPLFWVIVIIFSLPNETRTLLEQRPIVFIFIWPISRPMNGVHWGL